MRKKDCKEGLKVIFNKGSSDEDTGVIIAKDGSIFTKSGHVWVRWSDESILYIKPEGIELFETEPKFTIAEINAMLDEIESNCDNHYKDAWYITDRTFTEHGLDKVREYLKDKFEKPDLKKQALAKLTTEEIEALGIK